MNGTDDEEEGEKEEEEERGVGDGKDGKGEMVDVRRSEGGEEEAERCRERTGRRE